MDTRRLVEDLLLAKTTLDVNSIKSKIDDINLRFEKQEFDKAYINAAETADSCRNILNATISELTGTLEKYAKSNNEENYLECIKAALTFFNTIKSLNKLYETQLYPVWNTDVFPLHSPQVRWYENAIMKKRYFKDDIKYYIEGMTPEHKNPVIIAKWNAYYALPGYLLDSINLVVGIEKLLETIHASYAIEYYDTIIRIIFNYLMRPGMIKVETVKALKEQTRGLWETIQKAYESIADKDNLVIDKSFLNSMLKKYDAAILVSKNHSLASDEDIITLKINKLDDTMIWSYWRCFIIFYNADNYKKSEDYFNSYRSYIEDLKYTIKYWFKGESIEEYRKYEKSGFKEFWSGRTYL